MIDLDPREVVFDRQDASLELALQTAHANRRLRRPTLSWRARLARFVGL